MTAMSQQDKALREQLVHALRGDESHIDFHSAVSDFPATLAGERPPGASHTAWELMEHLRIAQHDILEFSRNPAHKSPKWPEGYWPDSDKPANEKDWDKTIKLFLDDAKALEALIMDPAEDLFKPIAGGTGQTLLREAIVAGSHHSYHLGQLVYLKKLLLDQRTKVTPHK